MSSLQACTGAEGDGIPPDKMQRILYDMNAAEVYSTLVQKEQAISLNRGKNSDSLAHYYNEILAHYNVTQAQFDKSMLWYKSHPARLDSIYNKMIVDLAKEPTAAAKH
ncbi:MAG: DUF4296 domain-containing protein [Bacteroidetes bacterium]|nr:DUF4296 domain-containing protein [Bacteroidota bacterium]